MVKQSQEAQNIASKDTVRGSKQSPPKATFRGNATLTLTGAGWGNEKKERNLLEWRKKIFKKHVK